MKIQKQKLPEDIAERLRNERSITFTNILEREVWHQGRSINDNLPDYELPRDIKRKARAHYKEIVSNPYLETYARSCLRRLGK